MQDLGEELTNEEIMEMITYFKVDPQSCCRACCLVSFDDDIRVNHSFRYEMPCRLRVDKGPFVTAVT